MLAYMHNDLIKGFEINQTIKEMWEKLKIKYGDKKVMQFRGLTLKFNQRIMGPKHCKTDHLRLTFKMIIEFKAASSDIADQQ